MMLAIVQVFSCLSLLIVALLITAGRRNAGRFLLPAILAATIAGMLLVGPYLMEFFVIHYSGAIYEIRGS